MVRAEEKRIPEDVMEAGELKHSNHMLKIGNCSWAFPGGHYEG
jgi:hypothetical protein